jgi:hypothetical protein
VRLFGYTAEEVIGKSVAVLIPTERLETIVIAANRLDFAARHPKAVADSSLGSIRTSRNLSPSWAPSITLKTRAAKRASVVGAAKYQNRESMGDAHFTWIRSKYVAASTGLQETHI